MRGENTAMKKKRMGRARMEKMGIKTEYKMILVKEEEAEIRKKRTGAKRKARGR